MEKMILSNKTELAIMPGAGIANITVAVDDWTALGVVAKEITTKGNLDNVKFSNNGKVIGEYEALILEPPIFRLVNIKDGKIYATIAMREKTEIEKRLDAIEANEEVRDGAILELAGMMGGE